MVLESKREFMGGCDPRLWVLSASALVLGSLVGVAGVVDSTVEEGKKFLNGCREDVEYTRNWHTGARFEMSSCLVIYRTTDLFLRRVFKNKNG